MKSYGGHRHCVTCGERLTGDQGEFCADNCETEYSGYIANAGGGPAIVADLAKRVCLWCGEVFESRWAGHRFCGRCAINRRTGNRPFKRRLGPATCRWCGELYINTPTLHGDCVKCHNHPKKRRRVA